MFGLENDNRRYLEVFGNPREMELASQGFDRQGGQAWMPSKRLARTKEATFESIGSLRIEEQVQRGVSLETPNLSIIERRAITLGR
jgi:hypothetical protein